jgi:hypothetical protein
MIITSTIISTSLFLDQNRSNHFEILGLNFIIDYNFKIDLIEINTNPQLTKMFSNASFTRAEL